VSHLSPINAKRILLGGPAAPPLSALGHYASCNACYSALAWIGNQVNGSTRHQAVESFWKLWQIVGPT
jgi:hypothetical protein